MRSPFRKLWVIACLILFLLHTGIPVVYSQDTQTEREITTAIDDAKSGNYQQAIPVLIKYADANGFDDLLTLQINVYLNFCYLATKNEALNVDGVNKLTDSYLEKYDISKTDSLKRNDEMALLFIAGTLNSNVGNNEKMVYFLSYICEHYEKYHIAMNKGFSEALFIFAKRYYDLKDFKTAADIGELAWKSNLNIKGEMNDKSIELLDILSNSYEKLNDLKTSLEKIKKKVEIRKELYGVKDEKYMDSLIDLLLGYSNLTDYQHALEVNLYLVELGKEILGEQNPKYITLVSHLGTVYSQIGDYQKSLLVNLKAVELSKKAQGEKSPDYLTSLSYLSYNYLNLGDFKKSCRN